MQKINIPETDKPFATRASRIVAVMLIVILAAIMVSTLVYRSSQNTAAVQIQER